MSGIYGEILLAFPEQFRTVTVYDMTAKVNGGWTQVAGSSRTIKAIYQNTSGRRIQDSNGNLVKTSGLELWSQSGELTGLFTELDGTVYRLSSDNNWSHEGGYYKYSMEKVVGNDGTESINTSWNSGTNNFG